MQSKNVLWLGLLFVSLLTVFCIAKYINEFNPNIKTITTPSHEIIDQDLELRPIKIEDDEVDKDYLQIIQLVEQEEKDIEDAYNKALKQEENKSKPIKEQKTQTTVKKVTKRKNIPKKTVSNKKIRLQIETVIDDQILAAYGKLTNKEKRKLKRLTQKSKQNLATFIRVETDKKYRKIYKIKKYLISLGLPKNKIQISYKRKKHIILSDNKDIEISVIKKD
jgi:hypothetical protein